MEVIFKDTKGNLHIINFEDVECIISTSPEGDITKCEPLDVKEGFPKPPFYIILKNDRGIYIP